MLLYNYISITTPDYDELLNVTPHNTVVESGEKSQDIHEGDDGSEERISLSSQSVFFITLTWSRLAPAEVTAIMDFYHDPAKANGRARSFKFAHVDGKTYVVRFDCKADKEIQPRGFFAVPSIKLKVLGKI